MIAMLLAAQLAAEIGRSAPFADLLHSKAGTVEAYRVDPDAPRGLIRVLPKSVCPGAGRMEVSQAQPTALYRQGDRPPHLYLNRYPEPKLCLLGAAP